MGTKRQYARYVSVWVHRPHKIAHGYHRAFIRIINPPIRVNGAVNSIGCRLLQHHSWRNALRTDIQKFGVSVNLKCVKVLVVVCVLDPQLGYGIDASLTF